MCSYQFFNYTNFLKLPAGLTFKEKLYILFLVFLFNLK